MKNQILIEKVYNPVQSTPKKVTWDKSQLNSIP